HARLRTANGAGICNHRQGDQDRQRPNARHGISHFPGRMFSIHRLSLLARNLAHPGAPDNLVHSVVLLGESPVYFGWWPRPRILVVFGLVLCIIVLFQQHRAVHLWPWKGRAMLLFLDRCNSRYEPVTGVERPEGLRLERDFVICVGFSNCVCADLFLF
ncbi:MAG: hypothetical protein JWM16_5828, partial [Verrucomicrobiales bacterium]|nr:hypothetical protein [Verrucomicrobiales bacterium]